MAYSIDSGGMPNVLAGYGSYVSPNTVYPSSTAGGATSGAISLGQQAYGQLPGYTQSLANVGRNIQSETAGEVPDDVKRAIAQGAAERGVTTGNIGGANTNADYLRSLGLTSLDLTGRGQQNLQGILPVLPGAQISQNPGFYVNPQLQYQAQATNAANQAAAYNANVAQRNSAKAVQRGYSAGLGSGGGSTFGLPQMGFSPTSSPSTAGPWEPAPVVGRGTGQLGTVIGGQVYYGDTGNIAQQIQNKYAPTVTGNLNSGYDDEANYDSGGSSDYYDSGDYYDNYDYYGDY